LTTDIEPRNATMMDIELLDHIVLGQGKFVSLKDKGLGF
jgi:DNA repair protein RadC